MPISVLKLEYDHDSQSGESGYYRLHLPIISGKAQRAIYADYKKLWASIVAGCKAREDYWTFRRGSWTEWVLHEKVLHRWANSFLFDKPLTVLKSHACNQGSVREREIWKCAMRNNHGSKFFSLFCEALDHHREEKER